MKFAPGTRDSITNQPYFVKSDCGRFTVTIPLGESSPYYGAWRVHPDVNGRHVSPDDLGQRFPSAAGAKQACEAHAEAIPLTNAQPGDTTDKGK